MSVVTWNPDDKTTGITLSNNNLTATIVNHANSNVRATNPVSAQNEKKYYEIRIDSTTHSGIAFIGLKTINSNVFIAQYINIATPGKVIGITIGEGKVKFYEDGVFKLEVAVSTDELLYPALGTGAIAVKNTWIGTANFGATPFAYPIPEGYSAYDYGLNDKTLILSDGEYKKYGELGWETVSTSLPNKAGFELNGMDEVTLLGRQMQIVRPSIQMTNEGVLGEGKLFKGKVDLKRYSDLGKLEVK